MSTDPGTLLVLAGPSGSGKTTLARRMVSGRSGMRFSVSTTTRKARGTEVDGVDYEFVTEAEFDRMLAAGALAESAVVHGHRYGTTRRAIEESARAGKDVIMDVDVQGGMSIKRLFPQSVLVFVLPPSQKVLEERLRGRATDAPEVIETRLQNAIEELSWAPKYDYVVVNESLDEAVRQTRVIVEAERHRASRLAWGKPATGASK